MKLGIGSYTYTWAIGVPGYVYEDKKLTALELVNRAAELGVEVVQICDNLPLHKLTDKELQEVRVAAEKAGIKIEVGTRGVEPEHLRIYLQIAEYVKSDILRVILHKNQGSITIQEAAAYIKEVLSEFEVKNISIAIENHERHPVRELAALINELNSPYAGICLDTVNSFGALESPREVIETLSPYTINLHFKDFQIKRLDHMMGFQITGTPAGKGMLDAGNLLEVMKEQGKDQSVILELWTPYAGTIRDTVIKENQWAVESINYLKEWIK
jgi:3-oxoisoapionate decarboxylase